MDFVKKYAVWFGCAFLAGSLWLWWWLQPERQVPRAQKRLITALADREFEDFARLLADDYRDAWGHDKAIVLERSREVLRHFLMLTIAAEQRGLEPVGDGWVIRQKITLKGNGSPVATMVKEDVNRLSAPFEITWRNAGGPTKWVVAYVRHPELDVSRGR